MRTPAQCFVLTLSRRCGPPVYLGFFNFERFRTNLFDKAPDAGVAWGTAGASRGRIASTPSMTGVGHECVWVRVAGTAGLIGRR